MVTCHASYCCSVMEDARPDSWNPYPPYVQTEQEKRRWRLAGRAALVAFDYQPGDALDRLDRAVIWTVQRTIFGSGTATGDGDLTADERAWLQGAGIL